MQLHRFIFLFFCIICSLTVFCQARDSSPNSYYFEHYSQEKGLSQGTGYAIGQFDGFMWFGTQDGFNRFDGYDFKVFRRLGKNTLSNSLIQALLADSKGHFWIGTGGGLNLYDKQNEQFCEFSTFFKTKHELDYISIKKIKEDRKGNIWIITDEKGVFRLNPATKEIKTFFASKSNIVDMSEDTTGRLWLVSDDAVFAYDSRQDTFLSMGILKKLGLSSEIIFRALLIDKSNNMWLGTYKDGVYRVPLQSSIDLLGKAATHFQKGENNQNLSSDHITCMLEDYLGQIWIGTRTGGISIYNPNNQSFNHVKHSATNNKTLANNYVWNLYEDKQHIVWIGLSSNGIDKYDPLKFQFHLIQKDFDQPQSSLPDNMIFKIFGLGDELYIGTETGGLARYSLTSKKFIPFFVNTKQHSQTSSDDVRIILADDQQNLWIGTKQGLRKYDTKKQTSVVYELENQKIKYLFTANFLKEVSEIWLGSESGLLRFDTKTNQWKNWKDIPPLDSISHYMIRTMYQDLQKNTWIGTLSHGLLRYSPVNRKVMVFDKNNKLPCNNIRSMLEDGQWLWIGTDCGLFQLDLKSLRITNHFTQTNGLPNEVIYGILKDENGDLWLSSNKGLAQFSPKKRRVVKVFGSVDGLQSDEFNTNVSYKHTDGTLFFGGTNGISYFKINELRQNDFVPIIKITKIAILDSVLAPNQKELVFDHNKNFIEIGFTALNFSNTEKNEYQYRLDNIDPQWVQAQHRRTANYTNLPPGQHVFRVRGTNGEGVWSKEEASVMITIKPPFWATWWFRLVLVALLLSGCYGVYRYRVYQLQSKKEQEMAISVKTQELERHRFSKELHDSVGANMAVLKMYLESLGDPKIQLSELKTRSMNILKSSIADIRSLIHDMHPRSLEEFGLGQTIQEMVVLINESGRIHIDFKEVNIPQKLPQSIEINLFRVVQELIQNTLKHAQATHVRLLLDFEDNVLTLTYNDNGKGINATLTEKKQGAGNGLVNIQQRIALLKGNVLFSSLPNQGTTVEMQVLVIA